jgi:NAD(P)-dependent dehydrogenase (short-subunit alcohol dehydrogenase family)
VRHGFARGAGQEKRTNEGFSVSGYLQDKVVAITGSGRGIGRSIALLAASEGAKVVVADYGVSMDGLEPSSAVADEVIAEIKAAGGEALAIASDVGTMAGGESIVTAAMDTYGRIDGAVCVAGILRERMLFNMSEDEFDDVIRVHLKGTFTVYRAAAAVMRKQPEGGSLIAFTSGVWALGSVAQANYAAAKGGIVSLSYSAAVGLERYGVRANVIAPVARTRMSANVPMALAENGDPEDIAPMAAYLLGDASKHITGQVYSVVGNKVAVWSQPKEVRAMYNDTRWTPELIEERLPATVKFERLPFLDMVEEMKRAAAAKETPNG